jgi:hypothetical protein
MDAAEDIGGYHDLFPNVVTPRFFSCARQSAARSGWAMRARGDTHRQRTTAEKN